MFNLLMKKIFIIITFIIFGFQNSSAQDLDRESIIKRLNEGYFCTGIFFEGTFSEELTNNIKTTHFYNMYHSKAIAYIGTPAQKVIKKLKKNKQKITKKEQKEFEQSEIRGKNVTKEFLKKDKFNLGDMNMVPIFIEGGNNKTGLIAKKGTEPEEMTECKQKFLMDEDDLLTTGVMSTKISKDKIKAITEKYLFGF